MAVRNRTTFTTVRTEGGLLPADLLQRISDGDLELGGLSPQDYHLTEGERLNEAINRSWSRLVGVWAGFQSAVSKLNPADAATGLTRERWLLVLFQELAFGRLQLAKGLEAAGKTFAISHQWLNTPIHLIGCGVDLDKRTPGVAGAARSSPHSLLQEFLNRDEKVLWGFVSNGLQLRLLRDNARLTRQAFIEFDLDAMMRGEVYSDFVLLWLICHQSRVEPERPEECWLERWSQTAQKQGARALDKLRNGVEDAIKALGCGFLSHSSNETLRERLRSGALSTQDFYQQILRLVYRLLFLFAAEDRNLLLLPTATDEAVNRYNRFYSTVRLRTLAQNRRGTRHSDLFQSVRLVMQKLGDDSGCPDLALPALGSFLFSVAAVADITNCQISNRDFFDAVRSLALRSEPSGYRSVDYKNLGTEELGGVYESLLELHPQIQIEAGILDLGTVGGHERKTSGSYYTPDSLVQCLLDAALEPVVQDAIKGRIGVEAEGALLSLRVCDPAVGSGHFLVGAAHRLATHLARIRAGAHGESDPSPPVYQSALRDVIGCCLYGVDINPMSAELCRVSLWLEALEPGKPLSFLDHHIRVGNSLLGATPDLIAAGLPDDTFVGIEGDDKRACALLKKRNRAERKGWGPIFFQQDAERQARLEQGAAALQELPDDRIEEVHAKEMAFRHHEQTDEYRQKKQLADAWCAAFVILKDFRELGRESSVRGLTQGSLNDIASDQPVPADLNIEVERLSNDYQFFHWHLAFPEVFANGGFDVVLGNPPWDTLSPDQREFFGKWVRGLRSMGPEEQQSEIDHLLADASIAALWERHCRYLFALVHFLKHSGVFTLYALGNLGKGDLNIYRMFTEFAMRRTRNGGFAALVVPGGLYGGANASALRKHLLDHCELRHLYGFINTKRGWFEKVDIDRFAAFAAKRGGRTENFLVQFGLESPADLASPPVTFDADVIRQFASETYAIPDVRNLSQLTTNRKMYAAFPAFGDTALGPPTRSYSRELDMGTDRELFTTDPVGLPVYEGRMIDHFDHRAKTYQSGHGNSAVWMERQFGDPAKAIVPQWRVLREKIPGKLGERCNKFRIGFADVANPRNERSFTATLIPPGVICGHKVPTFIFEAAHEWAYLPWLAVANAFIMDWLARCRLSAPTMSYTLLDSLPFPRLALSDRFVQFAAPVVLRLICTAPELTPFWNRMAELGFVEPIPPNTVPLEALVSMAARTEARAELDAWVALRVFGLERQDLSDALDTFDVLRRRDEKVHGEFWTKRVILEAAERLC